MANIPEYRDRDDNPRRRSDIKITVPIIGTIEASGTTVIQVLLLMILAGLGWVHNDQMKDEHQLFYELKKLHMEETKRLTRMLAVHSCVLSLNEQQRHEWRVEHRYCGDWDTRATLNEVMKPEAKK